MKDSLEKNICEATVFKNIYFEYAKDLKRFLFFKTQDIQKAEDLMQETFITLWSNCKSVEFLKVKSYLFTVANHKFLNAIKHENVVKAHQQTIQVSIEHQSPEFLFLESEFLELLHQSISALPEKQKEVFLLSRMEKKTYKTIASELNISVKAVEKRMHQALISLRTHIEGI